MSCSAAAAQYTASQTCQSVAGLPLTGFEVWHLFAFGAALIVAALVTERKARRL